MLNRQSTPAPRGPRLAGVTLVELVVSLALLGIFMAVAAPNFASWLQNSRIRNTAQSINAGLQLAKAEATARNIAVRFQLTTSLTNDCALSTTGTDWVVNVMGANTPADSVVARCATAPSDTVAPRILHTKASKDGNGTVQVNATASSVAFTGIGRVTPAPAANITFDVSNPSGGSCVTEGGSMVCLRVIISPSGQVRMCNPALAASEMQAC